MYWRLPEGEKWDDFKGEKARRQFKHLVSCRKMGGLLAFLDGEPIGWCTFGPRLEFPRLNRAPSLICDDADAIWSIPCFYVRNGYRGKGVASALLRKACAIMKRCGAALVEGYPVKPPKDGKAIPAAFAWTGTRRLFSAAGFKAVGRKGGAKQRVRRTL